MGTMLFYEKPEILSVAAHGRLGITPPERPFEFARSSRLVPLTITEISTAQKFYPVVFSEEDNPVPLAIVGLAENENLFVDESGLWATDWYIPNYVRCYPFTLARNDDGRFAVVIDRAAAMITEEPRFLFFDGQELAEGTQRRVEFCASVEEDRERTRQFVTRLGELGLLIRQGSTRQRREDDTSEPIASYLAVDHRKLKALPADQLADLNEQGYLWPIYAHLLSLENWQRLVRREEQQSAA